MEIVIELEKEQIEKWVHAMTNIPIEVIKILEQYQIEEIIEETAKRNIKEYEEWQQRKTLQANKSM